MKPHMFLYSISLYFIFIFIFILFKESSTKYSERLLLDGGRVLSTECDLDECDLAECDLAGCDLVECGLAEHGIVETTGANLTHAIHTYTLTLGEGYFSHDQEKLLLKRFPVRHTFLILLYLGFLPLE